IAKRPDRKRIPSRCRSGRADAPRCNQGAHRETSAEDGMKLASLLGLCLAAALIVSLPAVAVNPAAYAARLAQTGKSGKDSQAEVNVVLRISRRLVEE